MIKSQNYIIELALHTNENNYNSLNKRFRIAEIIYNSLVKYSIKQLKRMKENKTYKNTLNNYFIYKKKFNKSQNESDKAKLELYKKLLSSIRKSFSLSEYDLHSYVVKLQNTYSKHIDSNTSQKIATTVWKAVQDVLFKKGKKLHFKKFGQLTSLEGKTNSSGIMFKFPENIEINYNKNLYKNNKTSKKLRQKLYKNKQKTKYRVEWNKLIIPVKIRKNDLFIQESLETSKIKYCRIIRKAFKNGYKYFLQLIMEGLPPVKRINSTGEFRHTAYSNNKVGIDIGTSTIALCGKNDLMLQELAPNSIKYDKEINRLNRKLDRSKRTMNPLNFNADGTIRKGIKLKWIRSKNYLKTLFKLKNLYRLKANYIKLSHNKLSNEILKLGNEIYVETMRFSSLQKRSKKTTKNKKGKFNRKKRFGKSLCNKAPSMLLTIIDRKLKYEDKNLNKVNTFSFKASQYNHIEDRFIKKKLNQRWNKINNKLVQRDLYSAFLLMNSKKDLKETNRRLCIKEYDNFLINHDKCIEEIKKNKDIKLLSSFGIKRAS